MRVQEMSGCEANTQNNHESREVPLRSCRFPGAMAAVLSLSVFACPKVALCERAEPVQANRDASAQDGLKPSVPSEPRNDESGSIASGLCNFANPCNDSDCSTLVKCNFGCFGNPACASQCNGNPCSIGCTPCASGCPNRCDPVLCPQNTCITACGDPNCKIVCGGNPCNSGCPNRCDPVLCPANALCLTACGGSPCNVGCSPCGAGCPQECNPALCPLNIDNCVWNLLNNVSNRVNTTITRAQEARDRATEARNHAGAMVDNMQDGLQHLTSEMREWIEDTLAVLQQALLEELAGSQDFIDGPNSCSLECEGFRADLILLLTSIEDISNALLATSAISGQIDLSAEINFIESLSGKVLYPLYRALLALPVLDEEFLAIMSGIAADLEVVAPIIADTVVARGGVPDVCELLAEYEELVSTLLTIAQNIDKVGKGSKMAGSKLSAIGKSKIAGRAGVWGWAGVSYTGGLLERFGGHLESLGNRLSPIADKLEEKLRYCVLKVNTQDILGEVDTNHEQFIQTDQEILDILQAIPITPGSGGDLNDDGVIDLGDYALFFQNFGLVGKL